ncbi:galactokinase [Nonlabens spongiae]|uniref:Galactokinase n=1 Tax=Nonlabens spongiae TaxID=331648 RepID=A0A1W6MI24_9FLAO|nr:galactokinase [Nonlabens spongiae]ARN77251.1 galactokinase [Nonlabens spongiae]
MKNSELIVTVQEKFLQEFDQKGLMVFSPGRINLIGEHTDYNNGFVFPAAIDKGIALAIEKSEQPHSRILSLDMEDEMLMDMDNFAQGESLSWKSYIKGVVAEITKMGHTIPAFNCVFKGNIPVGAGLSSSAALENSLGFALNELYDLDLNKEQLIRISQRAEHNYVGVQCGIMDQFASMFGKKDHALFLDCKTLESLEVPIPLVDYEIVLVNSNVKHDLAESAYNDRFQSCQEICVKLGKESLREATLVDLEQIKPQVAYQDYVKGLFVLQENERVLNFKSALENNDLDRVGELLYESHEGLSNLYEVSCEELDFLVDLAKQKPYVLGSRMMGGGFGGCTINIVRKSECDEFEYAFAKAFKTKYHKDCSIYKVALSEGTRVIA